MMRPNPGTHFLLPALFLASLFFAGPALAAQTPPALTPAQQTWVNARATCLAQYEQQQIPFSQFHTFMNECMKENGVVAAISVPPDAQPNNQ